MTTQRQRLQGIRFFLVFAVLFLTGSFAITMYQAHDHGSGYGWGDTRKAEFSDPQPYIEASEPPNHGVESQPIGDFWGEVARVAMWIAVLIGLLAFWQFMLSRLGSF
jgi:hypothetical protein